LDYDADIYVIQECENPSECDNQEYQNWASNSLWIGDSKNKGLGIFGRSGIKIQLLHWPNQFQNHTVKHFLPCKVNNEFDLLGVWTHRNNSPNFGYIGQLWKYLQINKEKIGRTFIIGDFNSNTIWDEWDRWWNHSNVVEELKELFIESFYHSINKEQHGKESTPTLYFQKKIDRPYHIDYIFGNKEYLSRVKKIEIGKPEQWLKLSDHMPIYCEII
jgi:exonuclease III